MGGEMLPSKHITLLEKRYSQERPRFAAALFGPVFGVETTSDRLANGASMSLRGDAPGGRRQRGCSGFWLQFGLTYHVGCQG